MAKADAVLDVFPAVYGAGDKSKLLVHVARALAAPLEEADSHLFRIQRAHRLLVASHPADVIRLAGALDLREFHFEDLLNDTALDHELRLRLMRERVQRIARLHLLGLGTPWAVIEGAAIFLNANVVRDADGDPLVKQLDPDGFSFRATVEFGHVAGRPRERIVLHENPFRRNKVELVERWPGDSWAVDNQNVDVSAIRLAIRGVGEHTVLPTVFCPDIQEGIVFNGIVPDGATLLIDEDGGAAIENHSVDDFLLTYRGGMFSYVQHAVAAFVLEEGSIDDPFDGDFDDSPPSYERPPTLPRPPLGRSKWYFSVAGGIFDARDYDFAVYDPATEPVGRFDQDYGFDGCIYDLDASGVVGMAWDERVPCSFKLMVPAHVPAAAPAQASGTTGTSTQGTDYAARIGAVLPRFRAAGVRAFVDRAADAWILGQGVTRDLTAADGEGVDYHTLRLQDASAEARVAFDPPPRA